MNRIERTIALNGRNTPISIRRSKRAQRIAIRIGASNRLPELVLPPGVSENDGISFLLSKQDWLLKRVDDMPGGIPFVDGVRIPICNVVHTAHHAPAGRRGVWRKDTDIFVSGTANHFARRLTDWLRREARGSLATAAKEKAKQIGRPIKRITIRDQHSRWGSCSYDGSLSFNWRLILAPPEILDYVAAHEAAHLVEMNHSKAFWQIVGQLTPHCEFGRSWLKTNGYRLHLYGRP